jgi:hypothetical protein
MEWKPIALRPRRRPKMSWDDDVKHDLKLTKTHHWKKQNKSRNEWKRSLCRPKQTKRCSVEEEEEEEEEEY